MLNACKLFASASGTQQHELKNDFESTPGGVFLPRGLLLHGRAYSGTRVPFLSQTRLDIMQDGLYCLQNAERRWTELGYLHHESEVLFLTELLLKLNIDWTFGTRFSDNIHCFRIESIM